MGKKKPDNPPFKVDELLEAARRTPAIQYHAYYIAETDKVYGYERLALQDTTEPLMYQRLLFDAMLARFRERYVRTDRNGSNTNHRIDSFSIFPSDVLEHECPNCLALPKELCVGRTPHRERTALTKPIIRVTLYNFFDHGTFLADVPAEELVQEEE